MQNYRIISSSLSHIIHAKPSHDLHFSARCHICRTVALSPVHCQVSYMQKCRIISSLLSRITCAKLSYYLHVTITYHICRTITLSQIHCQVSYMQNWHITYSSQHVSYMQNCHIISSSPSRIIHAKVSHYLQFTSMYHMFRNVISSPVQSHVSCMQNPRIISGSSYRLIICSISTIFCWFFDVIQINI